MMPLGMSFSLLNEDQGLVKVDLSTILGPFDSAWFMFFPLGHVTLSKVVPCPLLSFLRIIYVVT